MTADQGPGPDAASDPGPDAASGAGPDAASGAGPDAASGAGPDEPGDPRLAGLLRWYPRAWRERYGDEFLAMVEDTLDGRRLGWRMHLGVIWAGLRERGRRAVPAALRRMQAKAGPSGPLGWTGQATVLIVLVVFWSTQNLSRVPLSAEAYRQARWPVSAYAMAGLCVVIGVAVTAGALAAGPALARFLRTGGWPGIRRQVAWAAGATAAGAGALTWFLLLSRSMTLEEASGSLAYWAWLIATLVPLGAALLFWRRAAMTVAGRLELQPGVCAVQVLVNAVTTTAADLVTSVLFIWYGQTHANNWLLAAGLVHLVARSRPVPGRLWWAWRQGQRLRAAGSGPGGAAE
jgi:hypothetical protein